MRNMEIKSKWKLNYEIYLIFYVLKFKSSLKALLHFDDLLSVYADIWKICQIR